MHLTAIKAGLEEEYRDLKKKRNRLPLGLSNNLFDTLDALGRFNSFLSLVSRAGLESTFRFAKPLTIFAPNDEAFEQAGVSVESFRSAGKAYALVGTYVTSERKVVGQFAGRRFWARNWQGERLPIDATRRLNFAGSPVGETDLLAENGIAHEIECLVDRRPQLVQLRH